MPNNWNISKQKLIKKTAKLVVKKERNLINKKGNNIPSGINPATFPIMFSKANFKGILSARYILIV